MSTAIPSWVQQMQAAQQQYEQQKLQQYQQQYQQILQQMGTSQIGGFGGQYQVPSASPSPSDILRQSVEHARELLSVMAMFREDLKGMMREVVAEALVGMKHELEPVAYGNPSATDCEARTTPLRGQQGSSDREREVLAYEGSGGTSRTGSSSAG